MIRRRQLGPAVPGPDVNGLFYLLHDNLGKADAFISGAECLVEQSWGDSEDDGDDGDGSAMRCRSHVELAVRAAGYTGAELEEAIKCRRGA